MPATPKDGQISFSQIKDLSTDKLGYTPPSNVSLGTLADVVRRFGQKGPPSTNLAFSGFYQSTIAGYVITTSSESFKKYYANKDDGAIRIWFRGKTFKNNGSNQYYVKVTTKEDGDSTTDQEIKLLNWDNLSSTPNSIAFTKQNSGNYTVTVTDLTTGATVNSHRVVVEYNGGGRTYDFNA